MHHSRGKSSEPDSDRHLKQASKACGGQSSPAVTLRVSLAMFCFVDHWPIGKDSKKDEIGSSTRQVDFASAMMILPSEPPFEDSHVVNSPTDHLVIVSGICPDRGRNSREDPKSGIRNGKLRLGSRQRTSKVPHLLVTLATGKVRGKPLWR